MALADLHSPPDHYWYRGKANPNQDMRNCEFSPARCLVGLACVSGAGQAPDSWDQERTLEDKRYT